MTAFRLVGSYEVDPATEFPSGSSLIATRLIERALLDLYSRKDLKLTADAPFVVDLDGLSRVEILIVRSSRKVTLTVTSADGVAQVFPADPLAIIISKTVPFTAVSLTRVAGQETTVQVFIGQLPTP